MKKKEELAEDAKLVVGTNGDKWLFKLSSPMYKAATGAEVVVGIKTHPTLKYIIYDEEVSAERFMRLAVFSAELSKAIDISGKQKPLSPKDKNHLLDQIAVVEEVLQILKGEKTDSNGYGTPNLFGARFL